VLVVDDEPLVRRGSTRILERMGFTVVTAEDGADALRVFERHREVIELVLLDMSMPVMGGAECFLKLRELSEVPVVIASGFALDHEAQSLLAADAVGFLEKPFTRDELRIQIENLLGAPHTS